jgi:hypothetical protein
MPLTPEQQERIAEEERRRVEEEVFRARIRDKYIQELTQKQYHERRQPKPRRRVPRVPGITTRSPLTWVYVAFLLLLSFVVARQFGWLRRGSPHPDPIQAARVQETPQPAQPAVFGERRTLPKELPGDHVPDVPPVTRAAAKPKPAEVPARTEPEATSTRNRTSTTPVPADIHNLLRRWTDTVIEGNADAQASLYGPKAEVYFTKRNVPHSEIAADKRRMLQLYPKVNRYAITNVNLDSLEGDRAVVSLVKDWDMAGDKRFAGSEKEQLTLARINGEWKIVGEKEHRVFWRKNE